MRDKELALETLGQIEEAATKIINRFEPIKQVSDFTDISAGIDKMDAICMMMIVIGEALKNLDKITEGNPRPKNRHFLFITVHKCQIHGLLYYLPQCIPVTLS